MNLAIDPELLLLSSLEKKPANLEWILPYESLIHFDRLNALAQLSSPQILRRLGALAHQRYAAGVNRWDVLTQWLPDTTKKPILRQRSSKTPLAQLASSNPWFRMRLLFGVNWRADMATVITLNLAENPHQAAKVLGCSISTSYLLWKTLRSAGMPGVLALPTTAPRP